MELEDDKGEEDVCEGGAEEATHASKVEEKQERDKAVGG